MTNVKNDTLNIGSIKVTVSPGIDPRDPDIQKLWNVQTLVSKLLENNRLDPRSVAETMGSRTSTEVVVGALVDDFTSYWLDSLEDPSNRLITRFHNLVGTVIPNCTITGNEQVLVNVGDPATDITTRNRRKNRFELYRWER